MISKGAFTILFFLGALWLPLTMQIFGVEPSRSGSENRKLEPKPVFTFSNTAGSKSLKGRAAGLYLDYKEYKEKFDKLYQDNFVLKEFLFDLYNRIQLSIFSKSPIPKKVVLGTEGWLFIGDEYSSVILESKAIINFSDDELRLVKQNLKQREVWLNKRGIEYYIAVAPEKQTFYGGYLPIVRGKRPTKWEQFQTLMLDSGVNIIDLSKPLGLCRSLSLYHKTDSHWNALGAFWASKALVKKISENHEEVEKLDIKDFESCEEVKYDGDLARMLNVMVAENQTLLFKRKPTAHLVSPTRLNYHNAQEVRFKGCANGLKVLVLRDSFCTAMMDFLKEPFGETVFVWTYEFNKELIEREKPDIVIQEVVERELDQFLIN